MPKTQQPERKLTDESLRTERSNTDQAMAERSDTTETDELLERARAEADAALSTARELADQLGVQLPGRVARGRAVEDEQLVDRRAAADESLRLERETLASLAALLPLEREKTDRFLLTERRRSDDALANRDDFMGMVSHDLRNLLSGIVLEATLVTDTATNSEEGRHTVIGMKRIQRYVARMNRLIGDLVDVVAIDAGKLAIHRERRDAAVLITEAVDAFSRQASDKSIALQAKSAQPALPAAFDHERMLQVLANLIGNAIKFTPASGRIAVDALLKGEDLHLCVTDTGAGIPNDMLESVFERFWQVGKNDRRGLGLGLYISRCIVDAHGGKVWAESTIGVGSAFHVTLPVAPRT
ncbi:MAG: HAMP domain-containing sensor histidine kinase [Deltaproteobacteria bacterium]|nr:HAMP domain-containing sensor histidine kinase [Deltaproteobacteria bacterium]